MLNKQRLSVPDGSAKILLSGALVAGAESGLAAHASRRLGRYMQPANLGLTSGHAESRRAI